MGPGTFRPQSGGRHPRRLEDVSSDQVREPCLPGDLCNRGEQRVAVVRVAECFTRTVREPKPEDNLDCLRSVHDAFGRVLVRKPGRVRQELFNGYSFLVRWRPSEEAPKAVAALEGAQLLQSEDERRGEGFSIWKRSSNASRGRPLLACSRRPCSRAGGLDSVPRSIRETRPGEPMRRRRTASLTRSAGSRYPAAERAPWQARAQRALERHVLVQRCGRSMPRRVP